MLLAQKQNVVGIDIDTDHVAALQEGNLPFVEPGIADLFETVRDRFAARTAIPREAIEIPFHDATPIETYLIATPTPLDEVTQVPDLTYTRTAVESVVEVLNPGNMIIVESTVPPGTTDRLIVPALKQSDAGPDQFSYAYCSERALPGNVLHEMIHNDRIIGGADEKSCDRAVDLYQFVEGSLHTTDPLSAEFIKLIENTYRDTNIALANESGKLAEQYGLDGRAAIKLANKHPRVDILSPGPGVGGHCLPIDPQFLIQRSEDSRLISLAREVNDTMPVHVLRLVRDMTTDRHDMSVSVYGVAYKGGVDDTRGTPARRFLRLAKNEGYDVRAHDPHVETFDYELYELDAASEGSDCLVFLADHPEYSDLNPESLASSMRHRNVVDTRSIVDRAEWEAAGFNVCFLADGS